jgi:hypothetical protein
MLTPLLCFFGWIVYPNLMIRPPQTTVLGHPATSEGIFGLSSG